jgi:hypothetical protein
MNLVRVVQENETLLMIAREFGFRTTLPLLDANPDLPQVCQNNFDVLKPGTEIVVPIMRLWRGGSSN